MALTYDCYVRIYVICDSDGNMIKTDANSSAGHFDLQINKPSGDTLGLPHSKNVWSYGPRSSSNNKGTLRFFNANNTAAVFPTKTFRLYYWHFTATENQVANFKSKLASCISSTKHTEDSYTWYDVTSNEFKNYSMTNANCFGATAVFTNWLGNSKLKTIHNKYTTQYKNYFAWRMWDANHNAWTGGTLYNA